MKKWLGGCLIAGVLVLVVGGGLTYWFVVRPLWNAGAELVGSATQWARLAELDTQVRNTEAFQAPADERLSAAQVQRFVQVQQHVADALGEDWKALEQKYEALQQTLKASGREPSLQELFGAYNDLSGVLLTAKQAQVQALNAQGLSLAEYRWVRTQAYAASGLALAEGVAPEAAGLSPVTRHNADLLRPHRALLQKTLATTWLGF